MFSKAIAVIMSYLLTFLSWGGKLSEPVYTMRIELVPQEQLQSVSGFGASACWWSQKADNEAARGEILRGLFGKDGLGLNIYRYNVGGGVNPDHNRVWNDWRRTESFLVQNEETGEWVYDFSRDALAQQTLFEALELGCIDTVILFANSPHYSMTVSGEASGGLEPGVCNLPEENYGAFVEYFLTITEYFLSKGVPVKYISPVNEPQWDWGGDYVGQEGCHYETEQLVKLFHQFAEALQARNLPVLLAAPESGSIGNETRGYFEALAADPVILRSLGSFCYHSYWADGAPLAKREFGQWYREQVFSDFSLDMSEWCELPCSHTVDDPAAAALTARVIANDLQHTGANSWSAWVGVNEGGGDENRSDGLFWASHDFSDWGQAYRSYALGHFSRFIPAGSHIIGSVLTPYKLQEITPELRPLNYAAAQTPNGDLVLVIANEGEAQTIWLANLGLRMEVYTTDAAHRLAQTYQGLPKHRLTLPAVSVTTVVLHTRFH